MESAERIAELLQEVNDNQKRLLQRQEESLQLQREHIRLLQQYLEHPLSNPTAHPGEEPSAGLHLQTRGKRMMDRSQQMFLVIIFLLVLLLFFVSWALFS